MIVEKKLVLEPGDTLILHCPYKIPEEKTKEDERYLSERLGIEVKIIDSKYEIVGVKNGKGFCEGFL